jgi:hypothetical protein
VETFSAPVQIGPGTHPTSYTVGAGSLFPGVKRAGRGVERPLRSSAEVKEREEITTPPLGSHGLF